MAALDREIELLAREFWEKAANSTSFPRSLEPAMYAQLPLAVVRLPRLKLSRALAWLEGRGIAHADIQHDRRLHGYLVARAGVGIVFLDGADEENEQRFSLAHEVAHFLFDYLQPRKRAIDSLGPSIIPVLDGARSPTVEERLGGVLRKVPLGTYSHLGRRSADGQVVDDMVLHIEDHADQLALELIAPLGAVLREAQAADKGSGADHVIEGLLRKTFGLPDGVAMLYARTVKAATYRRQSFRDWLGVR